MALGGRSELVYIRDDGLDCQRRLPPQPYGHRHFLQIALAPRRRILRLPAPAPEFPGENPLPFGQRAFPPNQTPNNPHQANEGHEDQNQQRILAISPSAKPAPGLHLCHDPDSFFQPLNFLRFLRYLLFILLPFLGSGWAIRHSRGRVLALLGVSELSRQGVVKGSGLEK